MFEHELKNAYIGEVYEYSYDFRGKTATDLTNEGFSVYEGTIKLNSNGLSSNNSIRVIVNKSVPSFSGARKITVTQTCILSNGSTAIRLMGGGRNYSTGVYIDNSQNYQMLVIGGTGHSYSGISAGTYTQIAVFDLVNKTATLSCTGKSDHTEAITDGEISNIENYIDHVEIFAYPNTSYIQTFGVTVEY